MAVLIEYFVTKITFEWHFITMDCCHVSFYVAFLVESLFANCTFYWWFFHLNKRRSSQVLIAELYVLFLYKFKMQILKIFAMIANGLLLILPFQKSFRISGKLGREENTITVQNQPILSLFCLFVWWQNNDFVICKCQVLYEHGLNQN